MKRKLCGSTSTLTGSTDRKRHLVKFHAGRMIFTGTAVTPDPRRGLVYLYRNALVHFCWKDINADRTEENLLIFPNDCVFKRIIRCTTSRVYLLRFKNNNVKYFFWMQESSDAKDEELCKRVNDIMNNVGSDVLLTDPNGMAELQLFVAQMLGFEGAPSNLNLSSVITADVVLQHLGDQDHMNALLPYLPPVETGENPKMQLMKTIVSPQFRKALSSFSSVFPAGELGPILSQFNFSNEAYSAVNLGNIEAFIIALGRSAPTIEPIRTEEDDGEDMENDLRNYES